MTEVRTDGETSSKKPAPPNWSVGVYFVIDIVWIVALVVVLFGQAAGWFAGVGDPFGRTVPFAVPWAGALGGTTFSLVGLAGHADKPNFGKFGYWHLAHPVVGAVFGTVGVLAATIVLKTATVGATNNKYTSAGVAFLGVVSFALGYRQQAFRSLIDKVLDLILNPAPPPARQAIALVPSQYDFGTITAGTSQTVVIHLFNGSSDTIHLTSSAISVVPAGSVTVSQLNDTDLPPDTSVSFSVNWAAVGAAGTKLHSDVKVDIANLTLTAELVGTVGT